MTNLEWLRREKLIVAAFFGFFLIAQTLTCAGLMLCTVTLYPDNNIWMVALALFLLFLGNIVFTVWSHLQTLKMYNRVIGMMEKDDKVSIISIPNMYLTKEEIERCEKDLLAERDK